MVPGAACGQRWKWRIQAQPWRSPRRPGSSVPLEHIVDIDIESSWYVLAPQRSRLHRDTSNLYGRLRSHTVESRSTVISASTAAPAPTDHARRSPSSAASDRSDDNRPLPGHRHASPNACTSSITRPPASTPTRPTRPDAPCRSINASKPSLDMTDARQTTPHPPKTHHRTPPPTRRSHQLRSSQEVPPHMARMLDYLNGILPRQEASGGRATPMNLTPSVDSG